MNTRYRVSRIACLAVISLAIAPQLSVAATDNATLQVGRVSFSFGGCPAYHISGYPGSGSGSYSPTGVTGGQ
jgi:hypothetical protein